MNSVVLLMKEWNTMSISTFTTTAAYLDRVHKIRDKLKRHFGRWDDEIQVYTLLNAIKPKYEDLYNRYVVQDKITWNSLIMELNISSNSETMENTNGAALAMVRNNNKNGNGKGNANANTNKNSKDKNKDKEPSPCGNGCNAKHELDKCWREHPDLVPHGPNRDKIIDYQMKMNREMGRTHIKDPRKGPKKNSSTPVNATNQQQLVNASGSVFNQPSLTNMLVQNPLNPEDQW
jgi:hypothetical protein